LRRVGQLSRKTVTDKSLNIDEKDLLADAAYLIGVTHDLGKSTKFFQDYIIETDEKKKKTLKAKDNTHHGLLSAFFTYAIIKEYLSQSGRKGELADFLPILSFLAVKRHHGNLMNAMNEISEVDVEREKILEVAKEQIESMDKIEINEILELLFTEGMINLKIDIDNIFNYILQNASKEISRKDERMIRYLRDKTDLYPYFITQFLYSALLDADKTDAGLGGKDLDRLDLPADLVDQYRDRKGFTSDRNNINSLRNQIYEDAMVGIKEWNLDNKILSLNVPTGTGKTLTSLSFALKLRDRLNKEKNFIPRIIYTLPFLSIIDQNYDVFEDVVSQGRVLKDSRLLLKHHHLADVNYKIEDKDEEFYKADESLLLLEGWNAEIIVTTFWQFFYTLFSNRNKLLRKFNKLANSIIILDEVQAVPHQYWQLIHDSMKMLCEKFNSYAIFVTATQPLIFDEAIGEIKEITQNKEEYFRDLDRIELIPRIETALTMEEFKVLLKKDLADNPKKDFLIVLNTISSSNDVYKFIKGLELETTEKFFLSTNVIPKERLERIKTIKGPSKQETNESSRKRKIIVSTQLIEAGVDIDADRVYRDFAPMDSINQVAGRCNRNSAKADKGTVSIFILKDDRKEFYKYIYDPFLMSKTFDILKPVKDSIRESEILELNNKYFKAVKRGMGDEKSKENLACLAQLAFQDLSKKFKLIEDDYPKVNVFVEIDEKAAEIWKKYQDLRMEKDLKERIRKKLAIRKEFSEYVISAPEKYAHNLVAEDSEIGYISRDELPNYYDLETGFMRAGAGGGSMII
jgi:CRISPR-associated endonuclease/helicase Cas3